MRKVEMYETADGRLFHSQAEAFKHADERYGEKVLSLAKRFVSAPKKYVTMCDLIEAAVDDFSELSALKADTLLVDDDID